MIADQDEDAGVGARLKKRKHNEALISQEFSKPF